MFSTEVIKTKLRDPKAPPPFLSQADFQLGCDYMKKIIIDRTSDTYKHYLTIHELVVSKLIRVLKSVKDTLPYKKPTLRVISLGYGTPDDFLALKALLDEFNPGCDLHYVGLDNVGENNELTIKLFASYQGIDIVTVNASVPELVKNALLEKNLLPEDGFDIIFLRHPAVVTDRGLFEFHKMFSDVIPLLSHEKSVLFTSAFNGFEFDMIKKFINAGHNHYPKNAALFYAGNCISIPNEYGQMIEPETHSLVINCNPYFYGMQIDVAHKKLAWDVAAIKDKDEYNIKILAAINSRQYALALRTASYHCKMNWLQPLLRASKFVGLNVNEASARNNRTALDWALVTKNKDVALQARVVELLKKHGAIHALTPDTSNVYRPTINSG